MPSLGKALFALWVLLAYGGCTEAWINEVQAEAATFTA